MTPRVESLTLDVDAARPVASGPAACARVSAILQVPAGCGGALALAHGAGAGMTHPFMQQLADELASRGIATLRYQFPFMEAGARRTDPPAVAHATVRAAVAAAREHVPGVPLLAGGKSFGGRMTSQAQAIAPLPGVERLVFVGFPLHAAGKPATARAGHLAQVDVPMLFVQGTRDALADLALLRPVVDGLGARARLCVVDDADHAFHVRKSSGRDDAAVIGEIAGHVAAWVRSA
jgi:predicted alpha/beta-hydrolase family hydrolase